MVGLVMVLPVVAVLVAVLVTYITPRVLTVLVVLVVILVDLDLQTLMHLLVDWVVAAAWVVDLLIRGSVAAYGGNVQQFPLLGASWSSHAQQLAQCSGLVPVERGSAGQTGLTVSNWILSAGVVGSSTRPVSCPAPVSTN